MVAGTGKHFPSTLKNHLSMPGRQWYIYFVPLLFPELVALYLFHHMSMDQNPRLLRASRPA